MARDNFPANIKVRLAQRAGYLCSICNTLTIGPSNESDSAINLTGVASHITAASSGFRRYDGNLTTADRMSIENGIWLCNTHGDLIDGDDVTYTTAYLKFLKNNHEENIKLKQSGIKTEKGILTKIEASNFGLFSETVKLDFSNLNIIFGNNGLGKTLILDLISSIHYKSKLNRWINSRRGKVNSFFNAYYFK
ncbi:MAG: hypothetical protein EOP45_05085 [Sphingobacteriaceae bacterium]|nr:MAG: hypothetical protein EOP45_05085 [Sphingobacteriaceae bacterium]